MERRHQEQPYEHEYQLTKCLKTSTHKITTFHPQHFYKEVNGGREEEESNEDQITLIS
uniref:Uncharacterized protein n=1 Tax=Arion vulgaris TaxID=1028688 RepID=A0A0B7BV91_9EUPU